MSGKSGSRGDAVPKRAMSRFAGRTKTAETLSVSAGRLGQVDPRHCPQELGTAIGIREVAALLGCSIWTVRQRYLPQGLPYLRANATGKFVFFREQVIDWILKRQTKGGTQ